MIRPRSTHLKIGWLTPTVGTFGAIREMVEVSNVLIGLGHTVYVYHPDGQPCKWLKSLATYRKLAHLSAESLDALIGIVDWQPELYQYLLDAPAKLKAICLLGFEPTDQMARALKGEEAPIDEAQRIIRDAMRRKFLILADSRWQIAWMREQTGYMAGPAFGGINLKMFHPSDRPENKKIKIIYSGDPRARKGTDVVEKAIELLQAEFGDVLEFGSYWGKRFSQEQLVNFYQSGDIFLDAHRRAGWCNPVAEAMACGCVPVCTHIGANRDFAIHQDTALTVDLDDYKTMAKEAGYLVTHPETRHVLRRRGLDVIQNFSYEKIVPVLERTLVGAIYD